MTNPEPMPPETPPTDFDVDGFVGALQFFDGYDRVVEYLYGPFASEHPEAVIPTYTKLARHEDPSLRVKAAVGITEVLQRDPELAAEILCKLLEDDDTHVRTRARESLLGLADAHPPTDINLLIRLSKVALAHQDTNG